MTQVAQPGVDSILDAGLAWQAAGFSVVRVATDGSKKPLGTWKAAQIEAADAATVTGWFADSRGAGVGLVMGTVSGHAEMFEVEGRAVDDGTYHHLAALMDDHGLSDLWRRLLAGYVEMTPSGGLHLIYHVEGGVGPNTKLARRPAGTDEQGRPKIDVLLETRGEGGFVVVAPSAGTVHPTGRPWSLAPNATPGQVLTLTAEERDSLHAVATLLDEMPPPPPEPDPLPFVKPGTGKDTGGVAPGDDYNERGTWEQVLTPHGWRAVRRLGNRTYWTRPGKTIGISAVTGGDHGDYFWCWSTSTELPTERALSKWRVYALLQHGGDFSAAAKALRADGYGQPAPPPLRLISDPPPTNGTSPVATLVQSDDGNALALVNIFGEQIRYCPERGRWLSWTGQRWEWCPSGGGAIREYAKHVARALPSDDTPALRHKIRALSAIGTTAMLTQASTDPRIVIALAQLDAHPLELNTPAGIVDLRTGALSPHDPSGLHTRITTCAPDPHAASQRWDNFLSDTFTGHDELTGYLQRLVGYAATGVVRDHVLPFAFGPGANGKGVFLETVRGVLGDYATTAPSGFLMARTYPAHETEIARLAGARMVVCSEVNEVDRFDEAKVKQLTGGDTLTARFMREDHFTFTPTHKLWLMGNHRPTVTGGGHSFWRRLRLISFDNVVPEDRRVDDLQNILIAEHGPAVLSWVIRGAINYLADGLCTPESVRAATAEYAQDQDTVSAFVDECCHLAPNSHEVVRIIASKFRQEYESWTIAKGEKPVSSKRLSQDLRSRFKVGLHVSHGRRFYTGIALLASEPDTETATRSATPREGQ